MKKESECLPYHVPALFAQCMDGLAIKSDGIYIDATFGGGGHSKGILQRLGPHGHLYSFDQDIDALANYIEDDRFTFVRGNFRYMRNFMRYYKVKEVDGVLADLGVSSHHFDEADRGFSFRFDAPLDMRMNQKGSVPTAAELLNNASEEEIAQLFYRYGELKNSRKLASLIISRRKQTPLHTINDLLETVKPCLGRDQEKKDLAKIFQSLRIQVNNEMEALEAMLEQALQLLKPGGRLAVISYHSLEDRLVKNFIRSGNMDGKVESDFYGNRNTPFRAVNNKVIVPDEEECNSNPRARSAKLRIAEKR